MTWLFLLKWLHLIGVIGLLGGLFFMNFVLSPAVGAKGIPPQFIRLMGMQRYRKVAWLSLTLLIFTGILQLIIRIPDWNGFLHSLYGQLLSLKIGLFLVMMAAIVTNSLYYFRKLPEMAPQGGAKPSDKLLQFQRNMIYLSWTAVSFGLIILLIMAYLRP